MKKKLFLILAMVSGIAGTGWAQLPRIISVGAEEDAGSKGRLSSIAVDTLNQPHIMCDGGSFVYMHDKVGGTWRSSSLNVNSLGYRQFYNPALEIDRNNRAWCSGILVSGLGFIIRENIHTTSPGGPWLSDQRIQGAWDSGNLSLDPNQPDYGVGFSARGNWAQFIYDASQPGHIRRVASGVLFAYNGGEKNVFQISKAGNVAHPDGQGTHAVWHAATDTGYQNSFRQAAGFGHVEWANWDAYPGMQDDGSYPGLCGDRVEPQTAYMVHGLYGGGGILVNIWRGNADGSGALLRPSNNLLSVDPLGWSGQRRYAPQWAPVLNGGAFLCWTRGNQIIMRYIASDGSMGQEVIAATGELGAVCTDSEGNIHLAYNDDGIKYRKITVFDARGTSVPVFAGDFDGDGQSDIGIFRPTDGTWVILQSRDGAVSRNWGASHDVPLPYDFDGDRKADLAVFRRVDATWHIKGSSKNIQPRVWGLPDDTPVPGDYDGDRKADYAVYRPAQGKWYFLMSKNTQAVTTTWGLEGDIPVPADYDGDGITDIGVLRPDNSTWYIWGSSTGPTQCQWGISGDIPVQEDYDGDGKADIAVLRKDTATWYIRGSTSGGMSYHWGAPGDIPVPGKYDPDRKADIAIFRPQTFEWYIRRSTDGKIKGLPPVYWGVSTDIPVPVDFNGNGGAKIAVFRPSTGTWYIQGIGNFAWGVYGDKPIARDYDGDGKDDLAVYRPSNGGWYIRGSRGYIEKHWGLPTDTPVPADYDGDGKDDIAIFRPSNGGWYILGSRGRIKQTTWGLPGDVPVPADYDNDGVADVGVFRPSNGTWYIWGSTRKYIAIPWGGPGDQPMPADYDNDGSIEIAVFRPSNGTWYIRKSATESYQFVWGASGDVPVLRDYDGDGKLDIGIYRPSGPGAWWVRKSSTGETMERSGPIVWGVDGDIPLGRRGAIE